MRQPAMSISTCAKTLLTSAALAFAASSGHAQVIEEEPDAVNVAKTPLEDLNIANEDIPEALAAAARDPYASKGLGSCNAIRAEIAKLDTTLGADFDIADETDRGLSEGRIAKSIIGSFIPFRGIVREISGANKTQSAYNFALTAGLVRRAFLKGLGQGRGCEYPARPREQRGTLTAGS